MELWWSHISNCGPVNWPMNRNSIHMPTRSRGTFCLRHCALTTTSLTIKSCIVSLPRDTDLHMSDAWCSIVLHQTIRSYSNWTLHRARRATMLSDWVDSPARQNIEAINLFILNLYEHVSTSSCTLFDLLGDESDCMLLLKRQHLTSVLLTKYEINFGLVLRLESR